jgi:hypothetical protein
MRHGFQAAEQREIKQLLPARSRLQIAIGCTPATRKMTILRIAPFGGS